MHCLFTKIGKRLSGILDGQNEGIQTYMHIHFLNPQKHHKTSGYETSQRHNRQHNNSTNTWHK